jgi:hypothetical protein
MATYVKAHFEPAQWAVIKITSAPEHYIIAVCGVETDADAIAAALNS